MLLTQHYQYCAYCVSSGLSLEQRVALIKSVGEEVIQEEELVRLLTAKASPTCYDGFEPSGRMHIAQVSDYVFFNYYAQF